MAKSRGVNMEKVKKALQDRKKRESRSGVSWFKPEEGWNRIRLLPPKKGDMFAKEYFAHRGLNKKYPVPCLEDIGKKCVACDFSRTSFKSGKAEDVEVGKRFRKLPQYLYAIVDLKGDPNKAQVMRSGPMIYNEILTYFGDDDYGDLTDPAKGFDVKIHRVGTGLDTEYKVIPARMPSALKNAKKLVKSAPILDGLLEYPSEDDMRAMLEGEYEEEEETEEEEEEDEDEEEEKSSKKAEVEEDDDDVEEEDEDSEEEESDEDEDDEDEESEDEEEEDSDDEEDEEEESEDEEDEEDDSEEEEGDEDGDDEEDEDEDEDEEDEDEDEEEEEVEEKPKKKRGRPKGSKSKKSAKKAKPDEKGKGLSDKLKRLRNS